MSEYIKNRYEFVIFFDVENGNPNGDPDADNMPRMDDETGIGIVSDVCIKRKIRDYVEMIKEDASYERGEPQYNIYVRYGIFLNDQHKTAYDSLGIKIENGNLPRDKEEAKKLTAFMCHNFFDIRTFGAVMSTEINCGQVRGPVQISFAKSLDPINPMPITLTRVTPTKFDKNKENKQTEFGHKYIVPYALYRCEGYISANLARKTTGFSEDDLELLWEAILNMFENDRSAARGKMAVRELIVFKHDSELGNAPAHKLFELVKAEKKDGVTTPRAYSDYEVSVDEGALPQGVSCRIM